MWKYLFIYSNRFENIIQSTFKYEVDLMSSELTLIVWIKNIISIYNWNHIRIKFVFNLEIVWIKIKYQNILGIIY